MACLEIWQLGRQITTTLLGGGGVEFKVACVYSSARGNRAAAVGLSAGCEAWCSVIAGLFPQIALEIIRAVQEGNAQEAARLSERFQRWLIEYLIGVQWIEEQVKN